MMKLLVVFSAIIALSMAQRGTYSGSRPVGVPDLASRFRTDASDSSSTTQVSLINRLGGDSDAPTNRIPTDARGDAALVERLNTWPKENRPFWLVNADHIEKHRHPDGGSGTNRISSTQNSISTNRGTVGNTSTGMPVGTRDGQNVLGRPQITQNRGSFNQDQAREQNSFNVLNDNTNKTYVYDPVSDSWKAMRT